MIVMRIMFDKDKPYWKAKEDRGKRFSKSMKEALAKIKLKRENEEEKDVDE